MYDEILITAPSATGDQISGVLSIFKSPGKGIKQFPEQMKLLIEKYQWQQLEMFPIQIF